jgi:hypothetical protein
MIRFALIFTLAFSVALLITYHAQDLAAAIFQELLSAFIVLATITGTLSYALYAYVEGVAKDVAANEKNKGHASYNAVIDSLSSLKKEILVNAFAVVGLLLLERLAHGFSLLFPVCQTAYFNWPWAAAISIRVACFVLSTYVAAIQFHGFIVANEYRAIISREK